MKKQLVTCVCIGASMMASAQQFKSNPFQKSNPKNKQFQKSGILVPQLSVSWNWDSPADNWETEGDSTIKTYDALGNTLTEIWISSSPFGSFKSKTEYTYDNRGLQTLSLRFNWNQNTSNWDESSKTEIYTSPNQDSIEYISYYKQNNTWIRSSADLTVYAFDQQKLISETSLRWEDHLNAYRNQSKTAYTYENDTLKSGTYQSWDTLENVFINEEKYVDLKWFLWNGDLETSLISELKGSSWDGDTWVLSFRSTSSYDTKSELTEEITEAYQDSSWVIEYASKYLITYNQDNVKIEDIEQVYNEGVYENNYKTVYSNFTLVNSLKPISSSISFAADLYPNPANNRINLVSNVEGEYDLKLFGFNGQLLFEGRSSAKQIILDRSKLTTGLYTYQIVLSNGQLGYGKLSLD